MIKKPELLSPGGNLDKMKIAFRYGADAVYAAGVQYGLRAYAGNFTDEELKAGIDYAHSIDKKVYVTVNIFSRDDDYERLYEYLSYLKHIGADAIIVSDPGIIRFVNTYFPDFEMHLSTQANTTNSYAAAFWAQAGIKRIVMARELSKDEINKTIQRVKNVEIEIFVHGAMCVSYSGRCLLSSYMANRDSNRGMCTQPCRWKYNLVEEQRPGEYYPVFEDEKGTYIFNSKDLCLIEHIPEIINMGVSALKIEGRMKSAHYVGTVTAAYRKAIDCYCENPSEYKFNPEWLTLLEKVSHRQYYTGFSYGNDPTGQIHSDSTYIKECEFLGIVTEYDPESKCIVIEQRNKFSTGDEIEVHQPDGTLYRHIIKKMYSENMIPIDNAPHPQMRVYVPTGIHTIKDSMVRKIPQ